MRDHIERLLLVLAVGATAAIGAKRIAVPYNVALVVVVGLLLVLMDVLPKTPMELEVILLAILPVLLFEGALFADLPGSTGSQAHQASSPRKNATALQFRPVALDRQETPETR